MVGYTTVKEVCHKLCSFIGDRMGRILKAAFSASRFFIYLFRNYIMIWQQADEHLEQADVESDTLFSMCEEVTVLLVHSVPAAELK